MAPTLYHLAPSVWGAGEELPIEHVVQAALFTDFPALRGTAYITVGLETNPLTGSWRVRMLTGDGERSFIIGEVPARVRQRYGDIERIHGSFMMPATTAELRVLDGVFEAAVILPPPELAVPRNDAREHHLVLPPGDMVVVDTSAGDFSAEELQSLSPGQWLVALSPFEPGAVVATLDGKVLGAITGEEAEELTVAIEACRAAGAQEVYARAVLLDGMAGLNVAGPEEGCVVLPSLKVPDPHPRQPWTLVDFPDGGWGVTVLRAFATDPEDALSPRFDARYVSLTGAPRPDDVAAATELFAAVQVEEPLLIDAAVEAPEPSPEPKPAFTPERNWGAAGEYLSEVEKVRLRRAQALNRGKGRHRK